MSNFICEDSILQIKPNVLIDNFDGKTKSRERVIVAIDLCIEKWKQLAEELERYDIYIECGGVDTCALCQLFHAKGIYSSNSAIFCCFECPIWQYTGKHYCYNTPYEKYVRLNTDDVNYRIQICNEEIEFLKKVKNWYIGESND